MWRTTPIGHEQYVRGTMYQVSPDCLGAMNRAASHAARGLGVQVLDLANAFHQPSFASDGIHFEVHRPEKMALTRSQMVATWAIIFAALSLIGAE